MYLDNVVDQFSQLGLEVYSQNFSATRPVVVGSEVGGALVRRLGVVK